jgi:glutamyl-tRNA synthetase
LGWSQGDREFFSTPHLIEAFSLDQVHRSPARFDYAKLENMNGQFLRATPDAELLAILVDTLPYLPGGPAMAAAIDDVKKAQLLRAMAGLKERAKTLVELADGANFLFARRPLAYEAKAAELLKPEGKAHLAALAPKLAALPDWTAASAEEAVRAYVAETGAKLGQVAQPLRAALTGRATSPGIFDVIEVLGRAEALGRISDAAS